MAIGNDDGFWMIVNGGCPIPPKSEWGDLDWLTSTEVTNYLLANQGLPPVNDRRYNVTVRRAVRVPASGPDPNAGLPTFRVALGGVFPQYNYLIGGPPPPDYKFYLYSSSYFETVSGQQFYSDGTLAYSWKDEHLGILPPGMGIVTLHWGGGSTDPPPPGNLTTSQRLLVPVMDADSVTGRASLMVGWVDSEQQWNVSASRLPAAPGSVATLSALGRVTGSPPMFMSSGAFGSEGITQGTTGLPWTTGAPVPYVLADRHYVLPQALFALPQQGLTRVCLQDTHLPDFPTSTRTWLESPDQGQTWNAVPAGATFPYGAYFTEGTARSQRRMSPPLAAMPPVPAVGMNQAAYPPDPRSVIAGAGAGFVYRGGQWRGVSRLPPSGVVYGALGAYSAVSAPPSTRTSPLPFVSLASPDGARTFTQDKTVPVTGGFLDTLIGVPGYPFTPQTDPKLFGALEGLPTGPITATFCAAGGAVWARGDDQAGTLYLFQPLIQRPPISRPSFAWDGKTLNGAFCQDTDPNTSHSGRDWGMRTGIGWVYTTDSGATWGTQDVVRVGGQPLIVDAATVRIAACQVRGHRILLCVCASGMTSLYASDDGARNFRLLGDSADGGATWRGA